MSGGKIDMVDELEHSIIYCEAAKGIVRPLKTYHSKLPEELERWYVYTVDGGHSIFCVLEESHDKELDPLDLLIPLPVKTVLRDYSELVGFMRKDARTAHRRWNMDQFILVSGIQYSEELGAEIPEGDEEY